MPAIYLGLCNRSARWGRSGILQDLLHSVFSRPCKTHLLDFPHAARHLSDCGAWCAQRHRARLENLHAHLVYPAADYRGGIMHAPQCLAGHRVPVQARQIDDQWRCILRRPRTIILFHEYCHGLYLYLCKLLLQTNQPHIVSGSDRSYRLCRCHPCRPHDFSCRLLGGCQSRQRSFAHLYHFAECVPAGLWQYTYGGLYHLHPILSAPVACSPDFTDFPPRGEHLLLP